MSNHEKMYELIIRNLHSFQSFRWRTIWYKYRHATNKDAFLKALKKHMR